MQRGILFLLSFWAFPSLLGATISLRESFDAALTKTGQIPLQQALERQTDERVSQAIAGVLPSINFIGTYNRQHAPSALSGFQNSGNGVAFRPEATALRLTATQPLFRGLREFSELKRTQSNHRAQEATTRQFKLSLYQQVASSFYSVLSNERELENLQRVYKVTQDRIEDLQKRAKIGRSRKGEVLSAQAQSVSLQATIHATESLRNQARESFHLLTGLDQGTQLAIQDSSTLPEIEKLDVYLEKVESRPDIQASKERVAAAEALSRIAWGGHFPSLDLTGNYHFQRPGLLNDIKWDVGLVLTVPLFQGGLINAQIREASEATKAAELTLSEARRTARRDVRTLHDQIVNAKAQYQSLTQAVVLAKENYREQSKDYRYGLVQNQDVIEALNTLLESERQMERTRFQILSLQASLWAATGTLPN